MGERAKSDQAPDGAKALATVGFLPSLPGLGWFGCPDPRFHRGLLSVAPPALERRELAERRRMFCSVRPVAEMVAFRKESSRRLDATSFFPVVPLGRFTAWWPSAKTFDTT